MRILCINPGSTSTKIALFENLDKLDEINLEHSAEEINSFPDIPSQLPMRYKAITDYLASKNISPDSIDALGLRGGPGGRKYHGGAYRVDEEMVNQCYDPKKARHPMCLSPIIAYEWVKKYGTPAYIYDVVMVDEMEPIAKICSLPNLERNSGCHVLNTRQIGREVANELGKSYEDSVFIICHMGGGISTSLHKNGRIVDVIPSGDGTFTPSRAGKVIRDDVMKMCYSGDYNEKQLKKLFTSGSGLVAHLGTSSCPDVEAMIEGGDEHALLVYKAMAYNIAKDIASLTAPVNGKVDAIILTGGIAYSEMLTGWIRDSVSFIAPVIIKGGAKEMEALAAGVIRVLNGEEKEHTYANDTF